MKKLLVLIFMLAMFTCPVFAGWNVTNLNPIGLQITNATGVSGGQQVGRGYAGTRYDSSEHAILWNGNASSWVDLNPVGATASSANGVFGSKQVGYVSIGGSSHAGLWSGTASSFIDLGAGIAVGVSDNQQVGQSSMHAALWQGTSSSLVDLNPIGAMFSVANAVSDGQQVGSFKNDEFVGGTHAALWSGSAESFIDLNPDLPYITSEAFGVSGGQQVGRVSVHAALWSGTAASLVDLNPFGARDSCAKGVFGGYQVGFASFGNYKHHAGLWNGTASSWVDLNNYLPTNTYNESFATGIDVLPNGEIFVSGYGSIIDNSYEYTNALLWHYTPDTIVPEPATILGFLAFAPAGLMLIKKKKA